MRELAPSQWPQGPPVLALRSLPTWSRGRQVWMCLARYSAQRGSASVPVAGDRRVRTKAGSLPGDAWDDSRHLREGYRHHTRRLNAPPPWCAPYRRTSCAPFCFWQNVRQRDRNRRRFTASAKLSGLQFQRLVVVWAAGPGRNALPLFPVRRGYGAGVRRQGATGAAVATGETVVSVKFNRPRAYRCGTTQLRTVRCSGW